MDIGHTLGADGGISVQALTLYVPNKDRDGKEIGDQRRWVLAAAQLLARIGGGVTIFTPCRGRMAEPGRWVGVGEPCSGLHLRSTS
jgi:hypothetical protein